MILSASVRYVGGVFVPEGRIMLDEGAKATALYAPNVDVADDNQPECDTLTRAEALLDGAEALFEGAFGPNGKDKRRIKRACRLAWDAAWMCVKQASEARGWDCDTNKQGQMNMLRLGGVNISDMSGGDLGLFRNYCAAQGFYERGYGDRYQPRTYYPRKAWQMLDGVRYVRELVRMLLANDANIEAAA